jgi:hypothetical protein
MSARLVYMGQKVSAAEIRNHESARRDREGTTGLEQCPGCPAGGMYCPDPHDTSVDGCPSHSTANYYATCGDATMAGGNL